MFTVGEPCQSTQAALYAFHNTKKLPATAKHPAQSAKHPAQSAKNGVDVVWAHLSKTPL